jgi:hypothetical protein
MTRVVPLSNKAKNRLVNTMESNPDIRIEQRKGNKVFFISANGMYCAWIDLSGDPNWDIVL